LYETLGFLFEINCQLSTFNCQLSICRKDTKQSIIQYLLTNNAPILITKFYYNAGFNTQADDQMQ